VVLDLNVVLAGIDDMLQRLVGEDVELVQRLDPALWPVKVDANQLEQVVMNLVVNASDAMPQGGRIVVSTKNAVLDESHADRGAVLVAGEYVLLAVSDTGCGMDEKTRKRACEPFFTTKEPGKGTGLGLSTVYGIVRQSGGGLLLESQPGRGTTARIFLLRSREEVESSGPAADERLTNGSETVLLVEDDAMFLELLSEVLEEKGYTVLTAADPTRALELCDRHRGPLDLLVSDMVMPGMTGSELAGQLVLKRPEIKVLLMSGYTDEALEGRGAVDDARAFLPKPFSTQEFVGTVRRLLDQ
jgi:CheY-like chemotaxis protein